VKKGYTYILECADGSYYTGSTKDLELRLWQHQNGEGANHTKKRLPVKLVYVEEFQRIDQAFYREKQIQGWSRKKKEALIYHMPEKLHELAKCMNETSHLGFNSAAFDSTAFDSAAFDSAAFDSAAFDSAAFDSAQAAGFDSAQPKDSERSLSEAEMKENDSKNPNADQ
jgi:putative endonuclease